MTTPIKLTRFKAEVWSAARSWITWVIVAIGILNVLGLLWNIQYLSYPFVLLWLGILPAAAGISFSQKLGIIYLKAHLIRDKLWPSNKAKPISHYFSDKYIESVPRIRAPVFHTMINLFGTIYIVYSILQYYLPNTTEPGTRVISVILLMLPCLMFSSALNVAAWLYRLVGFTHENKGDDGDRYNLGKDIRSNFGRVVGVGAAISFGFMFFKSPSTVGDGIFAILFVIMFCTPSTLFSYYLLKKKHLERMKREFKAKLEKYTDDKSGSNTVGQ